VVQHGTRETTRGARPGRSPRLVAGNAP
jgi:hypothetical protein